MTRRHWLAALLAPFLPRSEGTPICGGSLWPVGDEVTVIPGSKGEVLVVTGISADTITVSRGAWYA